MEVTKRYNEYIRPLDYNSENYLAVRLLLLALRSFIAPSVRC